MLFAFAHVYIAARALFIVLLLDIAIPGMRCLHLETLVECSTCLHTTSDCRLCCILFFFNDTATTEIYTLSLHDALPISRADGRDLVPVRLEARSERPTDL